MSSAGRAEGEAPAALSQEAVDARWMGEALAQARRAGEAGEVPVGAVLVGAGGQLLASGCNAPVATHDPSAHAEMLALRAGAARLGNYRLDDCTLYVTLEPCAMCAGAVLHARLARVVFGAADAKTGAAGSVLDLFAQPQLNHHTRVAGGVRADECGALLQDFFRARRDVARTQAQPLRDDALRTAPERFAGLALPDDAEAAWLSDLPALAGLRLRVQDSGQGADAVLCLHGAGDWRWHQRELVAALRAAGVPRVLAPDLIGFGHSDKPKRADWHTPAQHAQVLVQWLARLGVRRALVLHGPGMDAVARALAQQPDAPALLGLMAVAQSATPDAEAARRAPFTDRGYEAALRAFGRPGPAGAVTAEVAQRTARAAMGYFAAP